MKGMPFPLDGEVIPHRTLQPSGKRLVAAWRVLVGVWVPKRWDLSLAALSQYTTPATPKENPWIDRPKTPSQNSGTSTPRSVVTSAPSNDSDMDEPPVKIRSKRRAPSRRLVRHVLRARVEAVKSLSSFFDDLQQCPRGTQLLASVHLARTYGQVVQRGINEATGLPESEGLRNVYEIIGFLTQRGAKIPTLKQASGETEWAALLSEGEGEGNTTIDET